MNTEKLLLIGEDLFVLQSLSELLKSWKFETIQTDNSEEAFQQIKQSKISCVLLDIGLSDEDGLELFKSIKTLDSSIQVIVMTAYPKDYNKNHFFSQNAVAFLIKPIQHSELKRLLEVYTNSYKVNLTRGG
ncbi:MAG: response regulator [Planctomycetota bacterium]